LAQGWLLGFDSTVLPDWISQAEDAARPALGSAWSTIARGLHAVSSRTGLPVIVLAVLASVLAWRVVRRSWHVLFEIALAFGALLAATKLGLIPW
jgi:hypothetical protein